MSEPVKASYVSSKSFRPSEWPPYISKHQRNAYEHTRCRGFTPEEVKFFVDRKRWKNGEVVEPKNEDE